MSSVSKARELWIFGHVVGEKLESLDIQASYCMPNCDSYFGRHTSKHLKKANVSSLASLKQVSVRSCSSLVDLGLPPSLMALDASGCTKLKQILCPLIKKEHDLEQPTCHFRSLNLNGCRSLRTIGGPTCNMNQLALHIREMDLSSCIVLPKVAIADLLQSTQCLQSLSLRYIATDTIFEALAQSNSASHTLKLLDVAFSQSVTDTAVNALVRKPFIWNASTYVAAKMSRHTATIRRP